MKSVTSAANVRATEHLEELMRKGRGLDVDFEAEEYVSDCDILCAREVKVKVDR